MRFYYNERMNLCADENWVIDYLLQTDQIEDWDDGYVGLNDCRQRSFCGWQKCQVSDTIEELFI